MKNINLISNENDLYRSKEFLYINSLTTNITEKKLEISLMKDKKVAQIGYSINKIGSFDNSQKTYTQKNIMLNFKGLDDTLFLRIYAIDKEKVLKKYDLKIRYLDEAFYITHGTNPRSQFIFLQNDLTFKNEIDSFLFGDNEISYINPKKIFEFVLRKFPTVGQPSNKIYNLTPEELLKVSEKENIPINCSQFSKLFYYLCNKNGLISRNIHLSSKLDVSKIPVVEILLCDGHATNEIYNPENGLWEWYDLSLLHLGTFLGDIGPLSFMEFYNFFIKKERRKFLRINYYDTQTRKIQNLSLDSVKNYPSYLKFFHRIQNISFVKHEDV